MKPSRAILLATALVGCSVLTEPDTDRVPGLIAGFFQDDPQIDVPARAAVGSPFQVRVTTYGGGCITRGQTDVAIDDLVAVVSPYDFQSDAPVCTRELRIFQHVATVRFDLAGPARIVVRGRSSPDLAAVTFERIVVVE